MPDTAPAPADSANTNVPATPFAGATPSAVPPRTAATDLQTSQITPPPGLQNQQPPVAPEVPAQAPVVPDETAEKRLRDTQAWGHRQSQEAARYKAALQEILSNPKLAEALNGPAQGSPPAPDPALDEIRSAWKAYQAAQSGEEAFASVINAARQIAKKELSTELSERDRQQQINASKMQATQAVNQIISQAAPDVPSELFWALASSVEPYTPAEIEDPNARLQWQIQATIQAARSRLAPTVTRLAASLVNDAQARQALQAVMAPGTAPTSFGSAPSQRPMTMLDALKAKQAKIMGER